MSSSGFKLKGRERDRVISDYMEMLGSQHPQTKTIPGAPLVAISVVALIGLPIIAIVINRLIPVGSWWALSAFLLVATGALLFFVLVTTGVVGPRRRIWYSAMRRCGHDVCTACGYWLERRAPDTRICPECGTRDEDQIVPLGPRSNSTTWPRFEVDRPDESERDAAKGP